MHEEKIRLNKDDGDDNDEDSNLGQVLTEEEVAVYDRQIRLWGVESQKRLRKSKILICGMNCLGNEVSKNVILAGVEHMTILDPSTMTAEDTKTHFLPQNDSVGENKADAVYQRLHEMNPMVDLVADKDDISDKPESFLERFDVVCLLGQPMGVQLKLNELCHRKNIKFLAACNFGYYGYVFSDLGRHCFVEEKMKISNVSVKRSSQPPSKQQRLDSKETEDANEMVEKTIQFKTLKNALSPKAMHGLSLRQLKSISKTYFVMQVMSEFSKKKCRYPNLENKSQDWKDLLEMRDSLLEEMQVDHDMLPDDFVGYCFGEITPVSCIVGGILAQEIIKAVSGKDAPHNNFFFYDGLESSGLVDNIGIE